MLDQVKYRLAIFFPILSTVVLCMVLLFVARVALVVWQWDRVVSADGFWPIFISGARVDLASINIMLIIPALISVFLLSNNMIGKYWAIFLRVWITVMLWLFAYMEVASYPFIAEYDLRPNRLFIEYLIYPKEVLGMLFSGYKLALLAGLIVSVIVIIYSWKASRYMVQGLRYPLWYWRPVFAIAIVLVGGLCARSTLGHRPLNPAMVAFSVDPLMNDLVLNSAYSVAFAAKQMQAEEDAFNYYPTMTDSDIIKTVREGMNVESTYFSDKTRPSYANHQASNQGDTKNIVILLLESHGAQYVSELGGMNLSPQLDKLINEGWAFTNLFATGTRSVRGIEAVTSGFLPTPARSTVKLGKSQTNFFTIADLLKKRNYHTQFVYGGESHFDNMKSFFLGNGFVDMQDLATFENPSFVGSWGASDQDLYDHAHRGFEQLAKQEKPFFSLVFSSSNHNPFEYPDNKIEPYNEPKQTVENAVKYADFALGEYIEKAKKSNYWDNTIFVAIADHDARTYGASAIPIRNFHIPAVIFGGGVSANKDARLVSQIDIAPTLLSLAGISTEHPMVGFDLTKEVDVDKQRALMQRGKTFAMMNAANKVVVFKPEQQPQSYQYDTSGDTLTPIADDQSLTRKANALALWGSLAYRRNWYTQKEQY
jgi:phosphoglycerol transferase MdoB-like AlkP superfamily enzyme